MLFDVDHAFLEGFLLTNLPLSQWLDNRDQTLFDVAHAFLQGRLSSTDSFIQRPHLLTLGMIQLFHTSTYGSQGYLTCSCLSDLTQRPSLGSGQLPRCRFVKHHLDRQLQAQ